MKITQATNGELINVHLQELLDTLQSLENELIDGGSITLTDISRLGLMTCEIQDLL